eukprot:CAMPEP_0197624710 /NCGR_PEP_ID=MMETSP1338-20131121/4263_1 /TAXON_ID=43686 ORGANISM="Pelagodinium beii, Strain RCC1491" /NCGR_SAMPLE_ID=MMETSP1338 /ASSEMBLY_ACC=CAM_ASM_000754 /LENGTH=218 /DNA_ID=CAMNT_0043194905 /DNA_START=12 /DNA_END=664 /DNA_ORIENTATION=+
MSGYARPLATLPIRGKEDDLRNVPEAPSLHQASPLPDMVCPLGPNSSPHLTTPLWNNANPNGSPGGFGSEGTPFSSAQNQLGGLCEMDQWGWEMGSEAGSMPSAWSKPSTVQSSVSKMSSNNGDGLIPGLVDGQRLSSVKPAGVPTKGGKVVVSLRKEVPQGFWDRLGIFLVNGPVQKKLTPTGVKKGKKLCIEVPPGMTPGDYDVRLAFGEKIIHGA